MANIRTYRALIARGLDSATSDRLVNSGHTLKYLQQQSIEDLQELQLAEHAIKKIRAGRPPVSEETVIRLIEIQRGACCVCRHDRNPFVIHHILPWEDGGSQKIDNLVLLCPNHHSQAHSRNEISLNLPAERIRKLKESWIAEVQIRTNQLMRSPKMYSLQSSVWDYFNHNRLIDIASDISIPFDIRRFYDAGRNEQYLYSGVPRHESPYEFFESLLMTTFERQQYHILNNQSSKSEIAALAAVGNLVLLTACHVFKPTITSSMGPGQSCTGYYQRNRVRFEFVFDLWETTSISSHSHLRGHWTCTSVLLVRSTESMKKLKRINATCLAVGTGIMPYESNPKPDIAQTREFEFGGGYDSE